MDGTMLKKCVIIGAGTSVQEGIDLGLWAKLNENKSIETWALNFVFRTMPYNPSRLLWIDTSFFNKEVENIQMLHHTGVKLYTKEHDMYKVLKGNINLVKVTDDKRSYDKVFCGCPRLCGIFALSLAVQEKYDEIYLLGFDWGIPKDKVIETKMEKNRFGKFIITNKPKTHFYQDSIKVDSSGFGRPHIYQEKNGMPNKGIMNFDYYLPYKDKIFNVSMISNIHQFQKLSYQDFFERIKVQ
jgi:hypothetical protein